MDWDISVFYKGKSRVIHTHLEYFSGQVMRIRVEGSKGGLLLENNMPVIMWGKSKKGVKWKIREGEFDFSESATELLKRIFDDLEYLIKRDFKKIYPEYIA